MTIIFQQTLQDNNHQYRIHPSLHTKRMIVIKHPMLLKAKVIASNLQPKIRLSVYYPRQLLTLNCLVSRQEILEVLLKP